MKIINSSEEQDRSLSSVLSEALFTFSGRISRIEYWAIFIVLNIINYFIYILFIDIIGIPSVNIIYIIAIPGAISSYINWCLIIKRLHDRNYSASILLLIIVPLMMGMLAGQIATDYNIHSENTSLIRVKDIFLFLCWVIPFVSFICITWMIFFLKGTVGSNRFGSNPTEATLFQKIHDALVTKDTPIQVDTFVPIDAPAPVNELSEILFRHGYKVLKKREGWEIREPLGGRMKILTIEELSEYTKSVQIQQEGK